MPKSSPPSTPSPCLELSSKGDDPRELSEETANLAAWAWPMSEDAFLRDVFRQQALCVHSSATNDESRRADRLIRESLGGLEVQRLFEATASEKVFIWVGDGTTQSHTAGTSSSSNGSSSSNESSRAVHSRPGPPQGCLNASLNDLPAAPRPLQSVELEDPSAAAALHRAGHSAYCRAPPGVEQSLVNHLLADTGLGCLSALETAPQEGTASNESALARGEVEMFFGTAGHVTDWHFDFQENFTVQLSGSKRWLLARSPIAHPLRGHTPHYASSPDVVENQLLAGRFAAPNFAFAPPPHLRAATVTAATTAVAGESKTGKKKSSGSSVSSSVESSSSSSTGDDEVQVVVLHPGDVLYFPAGMWHRVETLEPGISLNVSLMGTPWADLAASAVRHALCHAPAARAALARGTTPLAGAASTAAATNSSGSKNSIDNNNSSDGNSKSSTGENIGKLASSTNETTDEPTAKGSKRKRGSTTTGSSSSSSSTSSMDQRGSNARASAAAVLAELKRVTEALTVDDLLPLVLSHPESDKSIKSNKEDDDGNESDGGSAEDSNSSNSSSRSDEEGEGPTMPPAVAVLAWQPPPGDAARLVAQVLDKGSLRWNPLAELVREGECSEYYQEMEALRQKEASAKVKAGGRASNGDEEGEDENDDDDEVWAVHVNYGNDSLHAALPKQRLLVPKRLQLASLWESVRSKGNYLRAASSSNGPERRALLGTLLYYGALSPA